jgi:2,3,4,5-tetrahydropyridine-2,6-dicarboxylate N-succinyltransferase
VEVLRSAPVEELQRSVEALYDNPQAQRNHDVETLLAEVRRRLNTGAVRSVTFEQHWTVNQWVRKALTLHVRFGQLAQPAPDGPIDLDLVPRRQFTIGDGVRITDASCFVRDGAYLGPGTMLMPGVTVQMAAWIGTGTTVGNGAGVGLCAMIGQRSVIGPGAQIQGHLLPLDAMPAVIGDGVSIGANCVIGNGVVVGPEAIVLPGTTLMAYTPVYDPVKKQFIAATTDAPLIVPPKAIVAQGSRSMAKGIATDLLMSVNVGVIAGYVDDPDLPAQFLQRLLDK